MRKPVSQSAEIRTLPEVLRYAWQERKNPLLLVLILVLAAGVIWLTDDSAYSSLMGTWGEFVEPFIGITTLIVAGMVWWGEITEDWLESLPKRLHVVFVLDNKPVMRCNYAKLSSESDIRQLGQQIGSQLLTSMNPVPEGNQDKPSSDPVRLTFRAASIDYANIGPHRLPDMPEDFGPESGRLCNLFEVRYELLGDLPHHGREGDCLTWDPPFDTPHFESAAPDDI